MSQISIGISETKIELSFGGLYGTQLVASMLNATAYGMVLTMALQYFKHHSSGDTYLVKGVVILLVYQVFEYFVLKFGRKELFNPITVSGMGKYVGIYLTAFVAQMFYATRIWNPFPNDSHWPLDKTLSNSYISRGNTVINTRRIRDSASSSHKVIVIQGVSATACDKLLRD
ncbi:hypothetical protein BDQ17DRAFT_1333654 [Cyathus striatus]|nr:hypothetical protein BDQ17DRAFT_1333654 [Cyathus striatus]